MRRGDECRASGHDGCTYVGGRGGALIGVAGSPSPRNPIADKEPHGSLIFVLPQDPHEGLLLTAVAAIALVACGRADPSATPGPSATPAPSVRPSAAILTAPDLRADRRIPPPARSRSTSRTRPATTSRSSSPTTRAPCATPRRARPATACPSAGSTPRSRMSTPKRCASSGSACRVTKRSRCRSPPTAGVPARARPGRAARQLGRPRLRPGPRPSLRRTGRRRGRRRVDRGGRRSQLTDHDPRTTDRRPTSPVGRCHVRDALASSPRDRSDPVHARPQSSPAGSPAAPRALRAVDPRSGRAGRRTPDPVRAVGLRGAVDAAPGLPARRPHARAGGPQRRPGHADARHDPSRVPSRVLAVRDRCPPRASPMGAPDRRRRAAARTRWSRPPSGSVPRSRTGRARSRSSASSGPGSWGTSACGSISSASRRRAPGSAAAPTASPSRSRGSGRATSRRRPGVNTSCAPTCGRSGRPRGRDIASWAGLSAQRGSARPGRG